MNIESQIKALRIVQTNGAYDLRDRAGRIVMFGVSRTKAEEFAAYYPGSTIVASK